MQRGRRHVRCTLCTSHRWLGNAKGRFKAKEELKIREMKSVIQESRRPERMLEKAL